MLCCLVFVNWLLTVGLLCCFAYCVMLELIVAVMFVGFLDCGVVAYNDLLWYLNNSIVHLKSEYCIYY